MTDETPAASEPSPPTKPLLERLSKEEKIVAGCSLGAMFLCLLPWWSWNSAFMNVSINAFDSAWGVLAFLCALASVGVIVGVKTDVLNLKPDLAIRLPMFTAGGATLCVLIFLVSSPGGDYGAAAQASEAFAEGELQEAFGDMGKTLWPWLTLLVMGAATYVAYQRFTASTASTGSADLS